MAETRAGRAVYLSCVPCDGRATVLLVPGQTESFSRLLRRSVLIPAGGMTLLLIIGSLLLIQMARTVVIGGAAWVLPTALSFLGMCTFVAILQLSTRGSELTDVQTLEVGHDLLLPAARLWGLALPIAYGVAHLAHVSTAMATLLTLVLGSVLAPLWGLCAGRGDSLRQLLTPSRLVALHRRLGADGRRLMVLTFLLASALTWWWRTSRSPDAAGLSLLSLVLDTAVALGVLVSARFLGTLAAARADALDVPFRSDLKKPALPGVTPLGVRQPRASAAPVKVRPKFLEL